MSPRRLFILTATCAALATPLAGLAGTSGEPTAHSASCQSTPMTLVQRRISEEAARGLPTLIGFVNMTQPVYQLRLIDAVAWLDEQHERQQECTPAVARATGD